jgi:hypothetical protein
VTYNHDWCYDVVRHGAENGNAGFADYWTDAAERAARTRAWYLSDADRLRAALR